MRSKFLMRVKQKAVFLLIAGMILETAPNTVRAEETVVTESQEEDTEDAVAAESQEEAADTSSVSTAVDFTQVKVDDEFWSARQKQVICSMIEVGISKVEASGGGFENFVEATKKNSGQTAAAFSGDVYFLDSDTYKIIEAASYGLQIEAGNDEEISKAQASISETLEKWIPYIVGAQESDGYLDTFFTLDRGSQSMSATTSETQKWTDFAAHELYVDGHFYEAAVAYYRATGDTRLLDVAVKNADLINSIFGEGGSKTATSGHQEIELALIKLAAACQEADTNGSEGAYAGSYASRSDTYIKLAKRFLDLRGTTDRDGYYSFGGSNSSYRQDDVTVDKQTSAEGHVVRAMYQYIAMADVTLQTGDYTYSDALLALWEDVTNTKSYVTGGMGITGNNESFGDSYELPVNGAYSETCGSIGSFMWNQRMSLLYGDSKYADTMENTLYNAILDGVNFDGDKFFYQNPISSDGTTSRSSWFGCACCPPNLMRLITSLGGYIYTQDEEGINQNLYIGNEADITIKDTEVKLYETSSMPWSGQIEMTVMPEEELDFELRFRVPSWCDGNYTVALNGVSIDNPTVNDQGYIVLSRTWSKGDVVTLNFDMPITRTYQSKNVESTVGYTAIKKGPIVYVAEEADNDFDLDLFTLPADSQLTATYTDNLVGGDDPYNLKGGLVITGIGKLSSINGVSDQTITLIPYYAWNNRGSGVMRTYINESNTISSSLKYFATASASYTSIWQSLSSINDGDTSSFWCSWINGSAKVNPWVMYEFDQPLTLSGCLVNWFADTADTRVPTGLTIEYWDGENWVEVSHLDSYDSFVAGEDNTYSFDTVTTTKIRMTLNNTVINSHIYALGINEWDLIGQVAEVSENNSDTENTETEDTETKDTETKDAETEDTETKDTDTENTDTASSAGQNESSSTDDATASNSTDGNSQEASTPSLETSGSDTTVAKKSQKITAVTSKLKFSAKKLAKKKQTKSISAKAKGKIVYKKLSGNSKIKVSKNGKVTVSKKLSKGTYKIKIKLTAKETEKYYSKSLVKTIKIYVK